MDISDAYIRMCDCPEVQEKTKDDRCSFWAKRLITGKFSVMCGFTGEIWLPRQDQIQEMMEGHEKPHYLIISLVNFMQDQQTFYKSGKIKKKYPIGSMEQIWLAFYMHEKHKKIWDGTKWKNTKTG